MDYFQDYYHNEDEIIIIEDKLKALLNMPLLDENNEMFVIKNYKIVGIDVKQFNWFRKPKTKCSFYIDFIEINTSRGEMYTYTEDEMCTLSGLNRLWDCRKNYSDLEKEMTLFVINNKIPISFNPVKV